MSYTERKKQIIDLLRETGSLDVSKLTKLLYASAATVRRDLAKLEEEGFIIRSHGKAVSINLYADKCVPYGQREGVGSLSKRKIAEAAVKAHAHDGAVIMLDASSTALHTVEFICAVKDPIVITSGINTLIELMKTNILFYSTGGRAINKSASFVGQTAIDTLKTFNADVCFVSCHGISDDGFVTDTSERENDLRRMMMKQSKCRVLLINESKIGVRCWHNLCHISEFDEVYCSAGLPESVMKDVRNFHLI